MGTLDEQIVIVTGAGSGIGKGIAMLAAQEGATVVIAEINAENGACTADEIQAAVGRRRLLGPTSPIRPVLTR